MLCWYSNINIGSFQMTENNNAQDTCYREWHKTHSITDKAMEIMHNFHYKFLLLTIEEAPPCKCHCTYLMWEKLPSINLILETLLWTCPPTKWTSHQPAFSSTSRVPIIFSFEIIFPILFHILSCWVLNWFSKFNPNFTACFPVTECTWDYYLTS